MAPVPAWIRCEMCEDWLCTFHNMHVYDCSCPAIEDWDMVGLNPYFDPHPVIIEPSQQELGL